MFALIGSRNVYVLILLSRLRLPFNGSYFVGCNFYSVVQYFLFKGNWRALLPSLP